MVRGSPVVNAGQGSHASSVNARDGISFKSKDFLYDFVESYISKVTSAGQLTLPKKVRKGLGLKGSEYVEVALLGRAVVIRRLREEDEVLETIRRKVKKSGLTRARMRQLVDEAGRTVWKKRYREAVR